MTETTLRHEVEVDTRIDEAYQKAQVAFNDLQIAVKRLYDQVPYRDRRHQKHGPPLVRVNGQFRRVGLFELRVLFGTGVLTSEHSYYGHTVVDAFSEYDARRAAFESAKRAWYEAEKEYAGWSRFFLALSSNGHIHSSLNCSTCNHGFDGTQFSWLTSLSGLNEEDAVREQGARLCSVCFPSAPVEWYEGYFAAKTANRCPGSGQRAAWVVNDAGRGHWVHACPVCGEWTSITPSQKYRAHDKKAEVAS